MSDNMPPVTHMNGARFLAQRAIAAQQIEVDPPVMFALPGALTPVHRDRLEAHQDDGLNEREIVEYENAQFLKANNRVRERHAQWVNRDYDAMVKAHREIEAEKRRREMEAAADYQQRLARILAEKDRNA
jgi:broad specificity phosphatase PhoE